MFLKKQLKVKLIKNTYLKYVVNRYNNRSVPFWNKCTFHFSSYHQKGLFFNCRINEIFSFLLKFLMLIWRTECITAFNNDF